MSKAIKKLMITGGKNKTHFGSVQVKLPGGMELRIGSNLNKKQHHGSRKELEKALRKACLDAAKWLAQHGDCANVEKLVG
jgi:hypothetical protein